MIRKLTQLSVILAAAFLLFAAPAFCGTSISNVVTTPTSPASLIFNEYVYIDFNYETDVSGGVLIFARPFSDGSLCPAYSAHSGRSVRKERAAKPDGSGFHLDQLS